MYIYIYVYIYVHIQSDLNLRISYHQLTCVDVQVKIQASNIR